MFAVLLGGALVVGMAGCDHDPESHGQEPYAMPELGTFRVTSSFDLDSDEILARRVSHAFQVLADLRERPGDTLLELGDRSEDPRVESLRDALPDSLGTELAGWVDEEVLGDLAAVAELERMLETGQEMLARFEMISDLTLGAPDRDGILEASHELIAVRMPVAGVVMDEVPVSPAPSADAEGVMRGTHTSGRVGLMEHEFAISYGEYALAAFEQVLHRRHGADIAGTLGAVIDCTAVASKLAERCTAAGCTGHEDAFRAICERGRDEVASQLRGDIEAMRFDTFRFIHGGVAPRDATTGSGADDGHPDVLEDGVWQAVIDLSGHPDSEPIPQGRELRATFTGHRIP